MTQEEKSLLLKDLCARSLYNVKCKVHLDTKGYCLRDEDKYCDDTLESVNCKKQTCTFNKSIGYNFGNFAIEEVKPYLRLMSSMTEEEKKELNEVTVINYNEFEGGSTLFDERALIGSINTILIIVG